MQMFIKKKSYSITQSYKIEAYLQWQPNGKLYLVYRVLPYSMSVNDSNPDFIVCHYLTLNFSETVRDIYLQRKTNRDVRPSQECHFEWYWVTLSNLAKYSMTKHRTVSLRHLGFLSKHRIRCSRWKNKVTKEASNSKALERTVKGNEYAGKGS